MREIYREDEREPWHLDKRVPLALILALLLQTVSAVWWAATIDSRVSNNEGTLSRLDSRLADIAVFSNDQEVQLGRIEEQVNGLREDIARLVRSIERLDR